METSTTAKISEAISELIKPFTQNIRIENANQANLERRLTGEQDWKVYEFNHLIISGIF